MNGEIDFEALGRRALVCRHWCWLRGMLARHVDDDDEWRIWQGGDSPLDEWTWWLPDLDDPCTLGGLLALVREAWGRPVFAACDRGDELWRVYQSHREYVVGQGRSEAASLVAALEAAPERRA